MSLVPSELSFFAFCKAFQKGKFPNIEDLHFGKFNLENDEIKVLSSLFVRKVDSKLAFVRRLTFSSFGDEGVNILSRSISETPSCKLSFLSLWDFVLSRDGVKAISAFLPNSNLVDLELVSFEIICKLVAPTYNDISDIIEQITGGLKSGMGYIGSKTIADMPKRARFIQITTAGLRESHPHSITITKEAPNYKK